MRKKRKGSETECSEESSCAGASRTTNFRSHFSLEGYARLKKRCKENDSVGFVRERFEEEDRLHRCFHADWSRNNGMDFACKTLKKGEGTVHREVGIMQHLSGHPLMVKEGKCSEQRAANIFKDLMLVISYCHEMGVVHRDVKPENILLTGAGKIQLADFGLAMRIAKGQTLSGLAGSPAYVAPEVISESYSEKVDVWSAGVLLSGVLPFKGDSLDAIFEAIKKVKLDFNSGVWESVSKPARDLLARMLTRDESARITADEVLRHPWILFYTDRTLKTMCIKSKHKGQAGPPPCLQIRSLMEKTDLNRTDIENKTTSDSFSNAEEEEEDESGVVDVLVVAISNVRISEPKRIRVYSPTNNPIEQQHSSNLTATNTLCRAF
ncbi:hypothetical protein F2Q69_00060760 [Brassica cretica]|uniref:Protein kinase domain-containing protein n=1 Tax=Brassica cretica TaxID=69181 RepID=A0A8S9RCZ9_BRACR|nr:hypothetical protein F2Q69_00060760 [Brassica cretica]